ncbi:MAG: TraR/DksA family transcriptional regulator [Acidimicrobiia bacterium]|nr:TraR/DksA family transcriptional regulator [Acidimicrobiia bacterium]MDH3471122.1 TraR/DksA family transcriptional regulator [Acidimicrobiia bacterium]
MALTTPRFSTKKLDTSRGLLLARRAAVTRVLAALRREAAEALSGRDLSDMFDEEPCVDIDAEQPLMLAEQAVRCLSQIEAALERLADGTYGYCIGCGLSIPLDRLEALPATARCVECSRLSSRRTGKSPTASTR